MDPDVPFHGQYTSMHMQHDVAYLASAGMKLACMIRHRDSGAPNRTILVRLRLELSLLEILIIQIAMTGVPMDVAAGVKLAYSIDSGVAPRLPNKTKRPGEVRATGLRSQKSEVRHRLRHPESRSYSAVFRYD